MEGAKKITEATIKRHFSHPIARVFRAWSSPRHLEGWLRPDPKCGLRVKDFDFREGGNFAFDYEWGDLASPVQGKFLTIVPEQTLIYTWKPLPPDPYAGRETMVSVWFRQINANCTEVELRHTLFPDQAICDRHEAGWIAAFDLLSQQLDTNP